LSARSDLAGAYAAAGRDSVAIWLYKRTLADRERVLGDEDAATISSRDELAAAYVSGCKYPEAVALYERVVADRTRLLGADHPDTTAARTKLAKASWLARNPPPMVPPPC
jgi:hypothetical protein